MSADEKTGQLSPELVQRIMAPEIKVANCAFRDAKPISKKSAESFARTLQKFGKALKRRRLHSLLTLALLGPGHALAAEDGPWLYEFSLGYKVQASYVIRSSCHQVIPLDPRSDYNTWNCGGANPIYHHSFGRRCWQPKVRKLTMYCVWEHMSHASDTSETSYDTLAIRGRFTFGGGKK